MQAESWMPILQRFLRQRAGYAISGLDEDFFEKAFVFK